MTMRDGRSLAWWLLRQPRLYDRLAVAAARSLVRRVKRTRTFGMVEPRAGSVEIQFVTSAPPIPVRPLTGDRVVLRPFARQDIVRLRSLTMNDVVQSFRRSRALWAIEMKEAGTAIGYCALTDMTVNGEAVSELGYSIAPSYRGHGHATEAAKIVRDEAFQQFELDRLIAVVAPDNNPSVRVIEKCGFTLACKGMFGQTPVHVFSLHRAKPDEAMPVRLSTMTGNSLNQEIK